MSYTTGSKSMNVWSSRRTQTRTLTLGEERVPMEKPRFPNCTEHLASGVWRLTFPGMPRWLLPWAAPGAQQWGEGALESQQSILLFQSKPQTRKIRTFSVIQGLPSSFPVKIKLRETSGFHSHDVLTTCKWIILVLAVIKGNLFLNNAATCTEPRRKIWKTCSPTQGRQHMLRGHLQQD